MTLAVCQRMYILKYMRISKIKLIESIEKCIIITKGRISRTMHALEVLIIEAVKDYVVHLDNKKEVLIEELFISL